MAERPENRPDDGATTKETETVSTETVSTETMNAETVNAETTDTETVSPETADAGTAASASDTDTDVLDTTAGTGQPAAGDPPAPAGWVPPGSAWPAAAFSAVPAAPASTEDAPSTRRRGPDALTLVVGLATIAMAVFAFVGELPDLSGFDPRWLLASGAALVGLVLLVNSLRSRTGGRRSG